MFDSVWARFVSEFLRMPQHTFPADRSKGCSITSLLVIPSPIIRLAPITFRSNCFQSRQLGKQWTKNNEEQLAPITVHNMWITKISPPKTRGPFTLAFVAICSFSRSVEIAPICGGMVLRKSNLHAATWVMSPVFSTKSNAWTSTKNHGIVKRPFYKLRYTLTRTFITCHTTFRCLRCIYSWYRALF